MEINWKEMWMSFGFQGSRAILQGITSKVVHCELISRQDLAVLANQDILWCLLELKTIDSNPNLVLRPPEVQSLVDEFTDIFLPPTGLPPKRALVHTIPLISGVQPFRLRPYRYNSSQKDEIERQVQHLLENGWVQESEALVLP